MVGHGIGSKASFSTLLFCLLTLFADFDSLYIIRFSFPISVFRKQRISIFIYSVPVLELVCVDFRMGMSDASGGVRRRGCSCTKDDFLPEESFKSWRHYGRALAEIPVRLKDRVLTRSMDSTELNEIRARSEHEMKKDLTWWDLMWFGIGAVIGAGIFVLTGLQAREVAGPAVVLSYVVSGISAMLSVFCYTEFAVEIPVAGYFSYSYGFNLYVHSNFLFNKIPYILISLDVRVDFWVSGLNFFYSFSIIYSSVSIVIINR